MASTDLDPDLREAFRRSLAVHQDQAYRESGYAMDAPLQPAVQSDLDRVAIRRALVDLGFLLARRTMN